MEATTNDKREKVKEPFWRTVIRTSLTGLVISVAVRFGQLKNAPDFHTMVSILFTTLIYVGGVIVFLGHYTELLFINSLRFKFAANRITQISLRFLYWYISGCLLYNFAMILRATLEHQNLYLSNWWMGGFYFIGIELVANLYLQLIAKKSFWNGVY